METLETHFNNDELLESNPICLEFDREEATFPIHQVRYVARLTMNGLEIGCTTIDFRHAHKELNWPTITHEDYKGRGYGTALYVAASKMVGPDGRALPLYSDYYAHVSTDARNVWDSLVRRGLAEEPEWQNGRYRYISREAKIHCQ